MNQPLKTLVFSAVLGIICSSLLVGVTQITRPYREANEKAERVRNTLIALEAPVTAKTPAAALLTIFDRDIRLQDQAGIAAFAYHPGGVDQPVAIAVPFTGAGVWGPIEGILALEPDMQTICGVRFYKQEETPGLGGEIASDAFQKQFNGKKILSADGQPGMRLVAAGSASAPNTVDAITGATMTSDRVEEMLTTLANRLHNGKEGGQ